MDLLCGEDVVADRRHDRIEQPGRLADPIAQRRAIEFEPLASIDLALTIQRKVVAVLRHQQMRERGRCGTPARGRHRRCRSLSDRIARAAGIFRPNVTNDLEVSGHIIQHLGHVLAELGHSLAAVRAGAGAIACRLMHDILSRQMIGQRLALRLLARSRSRCRRFLGFGAGDVFGLAGLQFLELEFELGDLAGDPLRRATELHSAQLGDLEFQLLDLQRLELHRRLRRLQLALAGQREGTQCGGIIRQFGRGERHVLNLSGPQLANQNRIANRCFVTPTLVAASAAVLSCGANPSPRSAQKTARG